MNDTFSFTLESPLTEEQINLITDAEFEHTDRIWFDTPKGKHIEFVKAPHWIPVDEKKPTPCEMVLLAVDDGSKAEIGAWDGNVWVGLQSRSKAEPIAWCPLPRLKPYEERRENDGSD